MTRFSLKQLNYQTIVITGASSGIGLATAIKAAADGATVVLVARDQAALVKAVDRIVQDGGRADYIVADVAVEADIQKVVRHAITRFGGFDTWVNNAGVGIYVALRDTSSEDHHRLFETNYWGVVNGSLAAARHFKTRPGGGAIINLGSIQSDMASPLLGSYNASKHAVKGFTDSLRIELLAAGEPVSVTLIKPSAIGTPFPQNGRNLTGFKARLPPPLYGPNLVADAILCAAQTPRRAITVGLAGRVMVMASTIFPSIFDRLAGLTIPALIDKTLPILPVDGNLYTSQQGANPLVDGEQVGRSFSVYTAAQTHRWITAGLALGAMGLTGWLVRRAVFRL